jgi:hypothetical protein
VPPWPELLAPDEDAPDDDELEVLLPPWSALPDDDVLLLPASVPPQPTHITSPSPTQQMPRFMCSPWRPLVRAVCMYAQAGAEQVLRMRVTRQLCDARCIARRIGATVVSP